MVKKNDWSSEEDKKLIYFYQRGYYAREIAKKLNRTKGAVDKRIQKFKKEGKIKELRSLERKIRNLERQQIRKIDNRENNNFLSNRSTIKVSMSAYRFNNMGDLILDIKKAEAQGYYYTMDMPKKLENTEKRLYNKTFKKNSKK